MDTLVIASNEADAAAAAAVEQHHAAMAGALSVLVERLLAAAVEADEPAVTTARGELVRWLREELVPHAVAEEKAMYPAARATEPGRLLVEGMLGEHVTIGALVDEIEQSAQPVRAAAAAKALLVAFESHLAKENDLVLPLLAATPGVSVADLLGGMHELLGEHAHGEAEPGEAAQPGGCGGHCTCGETDDEAYPELDARTVPHAIRHATIFGALDAVPPGGGLVLVAPHDPLPLLAQLDGRAPGQFDVRYLERGPEAFRLLLVRRTA